MSSETASFSVHLFEESKHNVSHSEAYRPYVLYTNIYTNAYTNIYTNTYTNIHTNTFANTYENAID
jgi:hypothetical protein